MADSPELPLSLPRHVGAKEQIRNRVRGDGVAKAVFAENQPLVAEAAKNARDPLVAMLKAKENRRDQERTQVEIIQRHREKIDFDNIAVEEAAEENFFHVRDDKS